MTDETPLSPNAAIQRVTAVVKAMAQVVWRSKWPASKDAIARDRQAAWNLGFAANGTRSIAPFGLNWPSSRRSAVGFEPSSPRLEEDRRSKGLCNGRKVIWSQPVQACSSKTRFVVGRSLRGLTLSLLSGLLCLHCSVANAQQSSLDRPAGIVDLARVFNEETKTQLESELKAFEQRSGIAIIVETETYIDSGVSTVDHCKRLQSEWLPTRAGIIICHNRADSNAPEVLFSPALEQRFSAIQLSKANDNSLREVAGITEARERLSKRIKSLMAQLLPLAEEDASGSRMLLYREDLFLAGGVALFLLLACLFHLLLSVGKSSGDLHSATQVYLPDVEVGQRFGATCGGGVMASTEVQQ